jgi:carbon storage regulator
VLVVSRGKKEKIVIGDGGLIEIVVVEIRGDKVRLGIIAPPDIPVDREEIYVAKLRSKQAKWIKESTS